MDLSTGQDELRSLAASYPIQAGALYTTFTDLMLSQQWHTLRLLDLKDAGWAVIIGQKTPEHPIRVILPLPIETDVLTPSRLKSTFSALSALADDTLPSPIPFPLARVAKTDGELIDTSEGAVAPEPSSEEKAKAGILDKETIYISIATPDSSVVYYKLSKGIQKPHDVPDE